MAVNTLLRMLIVHFVVSGGLYGKFFPDGEKRPPVMAKRVLIASAIYAVLLYAALARWRAVWIIPAVFLVFAAACSLARVPGNRWTRLSAFQLIPLAAVVLLWMHACGTGLSARGVQLLAGWSTMWGSGQLLLVMLGFVVLIWPAGYLVGLLTEPFRKQLGGEVSEGLARAGLWIGCIERSIIYIFVLSNSVTAIAFLVTAKSIFRFGQVGKPGKRREAEYILIGTLLSFATAMVVGYAVRYSISL
ncbi:MAG: hypothetical protein ACOC8N_04460 [Spirochaetota bacterium]